MCFAGLNRPAWEGTDGLRLGMGFAAFFGVGSGCSGIVIRVRHEALMRPSMASGGAVPAGTGRC